MSWNYEIQTDQDYGLKQITMKDVQAIDGLNDYLAYMALKYVGEFHEMSCCWIPVKKQEDDLESEILVGLFYLVK